MAKDCKERIVELYRNTGKTFNDVVSYLQKEGYSDEEIDKAVLDVMINEEYQDER